VKELLDQDNLDLETGVSVCRFIADHIDLLNVSHRKINLESPFSPQSIVKDEIVFFPGSFNPWHEGHLACLINCKNIPIVIIPDRNPWKEVRTQNPWDEVVSIKKNISRLTTQDIFIYPGFLTLNEKNPTSSWLPKVNVKKKWLLMGDDLFLSFHKWFEVQKIIDSLHGIFICPRGAHRDLLDLQKDKLLKMGDLEINFLDHHDFEGLSSTVLREKK